MRQTKQARRQDKRPICFNCKFWGRYFDKYKCVSKEMERYPHLNPIKEMSCRAWKQADAKTLDKRYGEGK